MILAYFALFILSIKSLFHGYKESQKLMESVKDENGNFNMKFIRIILTASWFFTFFLILFAKVNLIMPIAFTYFIILSKLLTFGVTNFYFENGIYNRKLFIADKIDQSINLILCGWVFYFYLR